MRPLAVTDAPTIHAYASDPEVTKYLVFPTHTAFDEAEEYLRMAMDRNERPGQTRIFAIERAADGRMLGVFDLRPTGGRVEIGYALERQFWGHGYMTEVLRGAIALLLTGPEVFRVESSHDPDNPASGRVMEKAGMVREGIMRRHSMLPNLSTEPRDMVLYAAV